MSQTSSRNHVNVHDGMIGMAPVSHVKDIRRQRRYSMGVTYRRVSRCSRRQRLAASLVPLPQPLVLLFTLLLVSSISFSSRESRIALLVKAQEEASPEVSDEIDTLLQMELNRTALEGNQSSVLTPPPLENTNTSIFPPESNNTNNSTTSNETGVNEVTTATGAIIRVTPTSNSIRQLYELHFTLDGVTGNGFFTNGSQIQEFRWFQQNLTYDFVPDYVPTEEVIDEVRTRCFYLKQSSTDEKPEGWENAAQRFLRRRHLQSSNNTRSNIGRQRDEGIDGFDSDSILFANTTYIYTYVMNYSSPTINVENYTLYYESTLFQNQAALTALLRDILPVTDSDVLVIQGLYPIASTESPTMAPSSSSVPSTTPTVSTRPSHSAAPTGYPTFLPNSTSSGRFDLIFITYNVTEPDSMFLDTEVFCKILSDLTPAFAPEGHNVNQISITCPFVTRGYTPLLITRPPAQTVPPLEMGGNSTNITVFQLDNDDAVGDTGTTDTDDAINDFPESGNNSTVIYDPAISVLWSWTIVMRYESAVWDVSAYPGLLDTFVNNNLEEMGDYLEAQHNLTSATNLTVITFRRVFQSTQSPTLSPTLLPADSPTLQPSQLTTLSARPSGMNGTTDAPEIPTTIAPTTTEDRRPSAAPVVSPPDSNDDTMVTAVASVVVVSAVLAMIALFVLHRKRRAKQEREVGSQPSAPTEGMSTTSGGPSLLPDKDKHSGMEKVNESALASQTKNHGTEETLDIKSVATEGGVDPSTLMAMSVVPVNETEEKSSKSDIFSSAVSDSQSTRKSDEDTMRASGLLSEIDESAYNEDDDEDENDAYNSYAGEDDELTMGEFERYKDKNLEMMRAKVENNVTGMDDMMSQAMLTALMTDISSAPSWHGAKTGVEIEATALWDVTEFLRRRNPASEEDRQEYMQFLLTKMVTSVRMGMLPPEDASRTIHECAALLNLELANKLPVTTIVLTGMQKTTTVADLKRTFRQFGPIQDAAVATNQRGFGIIRFANSNAANVAMRRFRSSEIVVKDVAITLKVLEPPGDMESSFLR